MQSRLNWHLGEVSRIPLKDTFRNSRNLSYRIHFLARRARKKIALFLVIGESDYRIHLPRLFVWQTRKRPVVQIRIRKQFGFLAYVEFKTPPVAQARQNVRRAPVRVRLCRAQVLW